jgi:hypothetical protein
MLRTILFSLFLLFSGFLLFNSVANSTPTTTEPPSVEAVCDPVEQALNFFVSKGAVPAAQSSNPIHINELYQVLLLAAKSEGFVDFAEGLEKDWGTPTQVLMFVVDANNGTFLYIFVPIYGNDCEKDDFYTIPSPLMEKYTQVWKNQQASD